MQFKNQGNDKQLTDKSEMDLLKHLEFFKAEINKQINDKFNELQSSLTQCKKKNEVELPDLNSYSSIARKPKDAVILKPVLSQDCSSTIKYLKERINPQDVHVGITKITHLKDGGVAVACNNKAEMLKLEKVAKEKLENFNIQKTTLKNPKIKIVGFSEAMVEEELKQCVISQNPNIDLTGRFTKTFLLFSKLTQFSLTNSSSWTQFS